MEMGRVWNQELDEEQKAPFQARRQQLVVKWKKAIEAYRLGNDKKGPEDELEGAHVVEKGDMSSKEELKDVKMGVEKDKQGMFIMKFEGKYLPAEEIVNVATKKNWGLYYVAPHVTSLEDIFVQLTQVQTPVNQTNQIKNA